MRDGPVDRTYPCEVTSMEGRTNNAAVVRMICFVVVDTIASQNEESPNSSTKLRTTATSCHHPRAANGQNQTIDGRNKHEVFYTKPTPTLVEGANGLPRAMGSPRETIRRSYVAVGVRESAGSNRQRLITVSGVYSKIQLQ